MDLGIRDYGLGSDRVRFSVYGLGFTGVAAFLALDPRGAHVRGHQTLFELLHDLQHGALEHVRHLTTMGEWVGQWVDG